MQGVIGEVAEIMCGSAEDAGSQHALRTILSQMTQYLQHQADGTSIIAQKCCVPHPEHATERQRILVPCSYQLMTRLLLGSDLAVAVMQALPSSCQGTRSSCWATFCRRIRWHMFQQLSGIPCTRLSSLKVSSLLLGCMSYCMTIHVTLVRGMMWPCNLCIVSALEHRNTTLTLSPGLVTVRAEIAGQCRVELGTILDFLAKSSAKLISQSMEDVSRGAQIRAFWLALASETSSPTVSIPAAEWLVRAALQSHAAAAQAAAQTPPGMTTASSLAGRLASVHLTAPGEGVQVKILACEKTDEGSIEPPAAAPAYAAAAVTALAALSRAPGSEQRITASQCVLMLLKPGRARFPQHSTDFGHTAAAAGELEWEPHLPQAEHMSDSLPADAAPVLEDCALVQLGHAAVKGLGDVSIEVAASWRRVLDAIAPSITRIAGNASRTSLAAFLLLHKVSQYFHMSSRPVGSLRSSVKTEAHTADCLSYLHGHTCVMGCLHPGVSS